MTRSFKTLASAAAVAAVAVLAAPVLIGDSTAQPAQAVQSQKAKPAGGAERTFKVNLEFNRWHDTAELAADMRTLEKAFPKFLKLVSLGKSHDGRDIWCMVINNPDTGPDTAKPAMFIEANVHGNEIQGGEICVYTIWYLMEHYGQIEPITRLVNERAFYIVPTVNPDGRDYFMHGAGGNARTGHVPVDDDNDGLVDEDDADDLNGNGVIEQIRKHVPGQGTHRPSRLDPRIMEPVPPGESGDYLLLGQEGIDNDGDGRVNEDGPGSYDGNRNWASDWQPNYIQGGAMNYPFQLPEAKAVNDFLMAHPNIAGLQSYHNSGGMILRGPGAEWAGEYPAADVRAYDELGRQGERMLPFYRYLVIWSGLYTVHGGFIDWTNDGLGIMSFSNELWNGGQYFTSPELKEQQRDPSSPIAPGVANYFFNDYLEFGDQYTGWVEFDHPEYGKVELGGWKKTFNRLPPRFMTEEMCHRNMAFTLYQAEQLPQVAIGDTKVEKVGDGVWKVWVDLRNPKIVPTIMAKAAQNNVVTPDILTLDGRGVEVVAATVVADKFRPGIQQLIDQQDLTRILFRNGLGGRTTRTIQYLLKGSGEVTLVYTSLKGGKAQKTIALK